MKILSILSLLVSCSRAKVTFKEHPSRDLEQEYPQSSSNFPTNAFESSPTLSPSLVPENYDNYAKLLTNRFGSIKIREINFDDLVKDKNDQCNESTLSPINIKKDEECRDDHQVFTNVRFEFHNFGFIFANFYFSSYEIARNARL